MRAARSLITYPRRIRIQTASQRQFFATAAMVCRCQVHLGVNVFSLTAFVLIFGILQNFCLGFL